MKMIHQETPSNRVRTAGSLAPYRFLTLIVVLLLILSGCKQGGGGSDAEVTENDSAYTDQELLKVLEQRDSAWTTDRSAPDDGKHTTKYITKRFNSFYTNLSDSLHCSYAYLRLFHMALDVSKQTGKPLDEIVHCGTHHWTMFRNVDVDSIGWSYKITDITNITARYAHVEARYELGNFRSSALFELIFERGDWYVDNFNILTATGFDGNVHVYEEQSVYYNEREMMIDFIREAEAEEVE